MTDRDLLKNMALPFKNEGDCFIHTEMRHGRNCETVICGDLQAIMWGIKAELTRWSEKTGCPYMDAIGILASLGYHSTFGAVTGCDGEVKPLNADYGKDVKEKAQAKAEKEAASRYAQTLAEYDNELTLLKMQVTQMKAQHEKEIQARERKIKALSKDVLALEHRIDEIIKQRLSDD
jgi:hypothetical protein